MGASQSTHIQVEFSRSSNFYFPGEAVSGNILFQNENDTLKLKKIFVELVGELGYTTQGTRSHYDENGSFMGEYDYIDYHRIPFLTVRTPLAQRNERTHKIILSRGTHTWPFEFRLPDNLPPSSIPNSKAYPHIKYYTRFVGRRQWYKSKIKQTSFLTISPRVNLPPMNGIKQKLCFGKRDRKQLRLGGYLLTGSIVPGQSLSFQLNVYNPELNKIKKITATFVQYRTIASDNHQEIILCVDLPGMNDFNEPHLQRNFDLLVPAGYLTPTHTLTRTHNCSYYISVHYELRLEVKSEGMFTEFKVGVPVFVGTELTAEQEADGLMMPTITSFTFNDDDLIQL